MRAPGVVDPIGRGAVSTRIRGCITACGQRMLASMSETDPLADAPLKWSDLGVSVLPTGMVTLLLADVEDSTRLWETQEMTAAVARLEQRCRGTS